MPRMKWGSADFDELPEEWDEQDFEPYEGPTPPANKLLNGTVKKMWASESKQGNDMIVVLFEAAGNTGDREQYNGWSTFDRIALTPGSAFRYGPLLEIMGVSLRELQTKTVVSDDEENLGLPILKVGMRKIPFDCAVITKSENYDGERQAKVGKYAAASKKRAKSSGSSSKKTRSRRARDEDYDDEFDDDDVPF